MNIKEKKGSWTEQDVFYTALDMLEGDLAANLAYLQDEHEDFITDEVRSNVYHAIINHLREIER